LQWISFHYLFPKEHPQHVGLAQQNGFGRRSIFAQEDAEASLTNTCCWLAR
jgi:hypothetical protein